MPDTFPLLLKEGKLFYTVYHPSPKLWLTAITQWEGENLLSYLYFRPLRGRCREAAVGVLSFN